MPRVCISHYAVPPTSQSSIPTLTKKKAELLMDVSKFEELIERLEKHKADQSRRLEAKHADIATKRELQVAAACACLSRA